MRTMDDQSAIFQGEGREQAPIPAAHSEGRRSALQY